MNPLESLYDDTEYERYVRRIIISHRVHDTILAIIALILGVIAVGLFVLATPAQRSAECDIAAEMMERAK